AWRAKKAMISSAMLPNVAFRIPPSWGPVISPRRSVASPISQASPRIERADRPNTTVGSRPGTNALTAIVAIPRRATRIAIARVAGFTAPGTARPPCAARGSVIGARSASVGRRVQPPPRQAGLGGDLSGGLSPGDPRRRAPVDLRERGLDAVV